VGEVARRQREETSQVRAHAGGGLDGGKESLVDRSLSEDALVREQSALLLVLLGEELLLGLLLLRGLGALEEGVVDVLGHGDLGEIDLGRGGDDVRLVDATERDTVDLVRACDTKRGQY